LSQDELYARAIDDFGPALERVARSYEADSDKRRDLLQEIHLAMWRSFEHFQRQCSLRTWVYRIAHNVGATRAIVTKAYAPIFETGIVGALLIRTKNTVRPSDASDVQFLRLRMAEEENDPDR